MAKSDFKIFWLFYKKNKGSLFTNVIGLASAIACVIVILLWVKDEVNKDKFHENNDRLFQIMGNQHNIDEIVTAEGLPCILDKALIAEVPEIESAVSVASNFWHRKSNLFSDKNVKAEVKFVSKNFCDVFSYKIIDGDKNNLFPETNACVISESLAKQLFNTTKDIVGRTVKWQLDNFKQRDVVITGLMKDVESKSSDQFDYLMNIEVFYDILGHWNWDNWLNANSEVYVLFKDDQDLSRFNNKIKDFIKEHDERSNLTLFARQYCDKYLYDRYKNGVLVGGRIEYVKMIGIIALFILIMACINFMNLSTAQASKRTKEIGIKKTIGTSRFALIFQYLSESTFIATISFAVAILIVIIVLPGFNSISGKNLSLEFNLNYMLFVVAIILFTSLLSGSYPAFYLSKLRPVDIFKGKLKKSSGEVRVRQGLVLFQFTISTLLIVFIIIVFEQIKFTQNKSLGYEKDNIIYFDKDGSLLDQQNYNALLSECNEIPYIKNISSVSRTMVKGGTYTIGVDWEGKDVNEEYRFEYILCDYNFIETLGIKMSEGRSFTKGYQSDYGKIIFNQAAIDIMKIDKPIGAKVVQWGQEKEIIGVTTNFHFESLHEEIKPAFFVLDPNSSSYIMANISSGNEKKAIRKLKNLYEELNPGYTFNYNFLNDTYNSLYVSETRVGKISMFFVFLAILVSCLGLFGLTMFSIERRLKEISVRKALGADKLVIANLMYKDFTLIILIAIPIGIFLGYLLGNFWLENFTYKLFLKVWFFAVPSVLILLLTWITVGVQTIKIAKCNIADTLRLND